jgi:hypothetical protein
MKAIEAGVAAGLGLAQIIDANPGMPSIAAMKAGERTHLAQCYLTAKRAAGPAPARIMVDSTVATD